jgi:nucleotide-binding universal stress UspA family protein
VFRNLLVGLDRSSCADYALTRAIDLAERHHGRLTVLTVVPEVHAWATAPVETVTASRQLVAELEMEAAAIQRRALDRVPQCVPTVTILRRGAPRAVFLKELRCGEYDVLVIGAGPARRPGVRLTRSFTRYLVARSPVAVLVIEPDSNERLHVPERPGPAPPPEISETVDVVHAPPAPWRR